MKDLLTSRTIPVHLCIVFSLALAVLVSACGSDDGGGTVPPAAGASLSGTAATGAAIANATVTVKDSSGTTVTATTDAMGNYSIDVTGLAAPFMVKVDLPTPATGSLFRFFF